MAEEFQYDEPDALGNGVRMYPKDCLNHLLLVWPVQYLESSPTQFTKPGQPSDVVIVDVVNLSMPDPETGLPGLLARMAWWRQSKLIQALKGKIGKGPYLVTMGKGPAASGRNAPFILTSQTGDARARELSDGWRARNPDFSPSNPIVTPPRTESTEDSLAGAEPLPPPRPSTTAAAPVATAEQRATVLERLAQQSTQGYSWTQPQESKPPF